MGGVSDPWRRASLPRLPFGAGDVAGLNRAGAGRYGADTALAFPAAWCDVAGTRRRYRRACGGWSGNRKPFQASPAPCADRRAPFGVGAVRQGRVGARSGRRKAYRRRRRATG